MKNVVVRFSIMTTYQLNVVQNLAIMTVKLISVTYEVAFDELYFSEANLVPWRAKLCTTVGKLRRMLDKFISTNYATKLLPCTAKIALHSKNVVSKML